MSRRSLLCFACLSGRGLRKSSHEAAIIASRVIAREIRESARKSGEEEAGNWEKRENREEEKNAVVERYARLLGLSMSMFFVEGEEDR